jgi:protein-S-isoprenylcysteine O-methyltransferase Ste14
VGVTGVILFAIVVFWQPLPEVVFHVTGAARVPFWIAYGIGWSIVVASAMLIDNKHLHGIRQSFSGNPSERTEHLVTPSLYKVVRHPMMLGFLVVLWASPDMTQGRLLIAAVMTMHILIGTRFEERALRRRFGREYEEYCERVPSLLPWPR